MKEKHTHSRLLGVVAFAAAAIALVMWSSVNASAVERGTGTLALNDDARAACVQWLKQSASHPNEYVTSKFADHDLVLLGETHEVKDNCEFVASLVAPLYKAGVRTLCSEFICSRNNSRLAELVTAKAYDEAAVVDMFRSGPWPTWGYQEYMDIVRAVWSFNRSLPAEAEPFRMLGIDSDWKQIDILAKEPSARMKTVLAREEHMVAVIESEVFMKGRKALLHIGFAHTVRQGKRVAAELALSHGKRMYQVCMHHEMPGTGSASRFTGFIEEVVAMAKVGSVGFDVAGTPFCALRDDQGQYFQMLGRNSTFQDFAEGYVFLKPIKELKSVTWVKGFIVSDTFSEAKEVSEKLRWVGKGKCATPEELDAALAARLVKRQKTSATSASPSR